MQSIANIENIRVKRILRKLLLKRNLNNQDILFLGDYMSNFNNNDSKTIKAILYRFNCFKEFVLNYSNLKQMQTLNKEIEQIRLEYNNLSPKIPFYNSFDKNSNLKDLFNLLDKPLKINFDKNSNHINFNYCIKVNIQRLLDLLYYDKHLLEIIVNKSINHLNSSDLIGFKISFENYYNNKAIYYYALKLFKYYSSDYNYFYCLMLKSDFYSLRFKLNSNDIKSYYQNNSKSYYNNQYLKKGKYSYYLSLKKVNKQYKSYSTKKYDIYSSFDRLKLKDSFNQELIYFLDYNYNKQLDYLINDLNSLLDNIDKNKRINLFIKELEFILNKNTLFFDSDNIYKSKINNHIEFVIEQLELELKNIDLYQEYSLYNDLNNSNLKKSKSKNVYQVIDNNYNLDSDNNYYNKLELVYKLKE